MKPLIFATFLLAILSSPIFAQEADFAADSEPLTEEEIRLYTATDSIRGEQGIVTLGDSKAQLSIPEGLVFIDADQTRHLLEDYWSNPEDESMLGALVSAKSLIFDDVDNVFLFSYNDEGYVSDDDAADIDYDDLLSSLQEQTEEANGERSAQGCYIVHLSGWACPPSYDADRHLLRWAKNITVELEDTTQSTLNYDIRILGKDGFVIVQSVASMDDSESVIAMGDKIAGAVSFQEGYRYEDFDPSRDNVAKWTIGGLVAGKMLAKAGILAKLGVFFAKFWKLIILVVAAVGGFFSKLFKKKADEADKE